MPEIYIALQALNLFWLIGLTLATWLRKPGVEAGASARRIEQEFATALRKLTEDTEQAFSEYATRLADVETQLRYVPSREEVARLEGTVDKVAERMSGIADALTGLRGAVHRVENYLLTQRAAA